MPPTAISNGNSAHQNGHTDEARVETSTRYSVHDQVWDRQYGIWTKAPAPPKALSDGQEAFVAYRRTSANTNNADPFTHIDLQDQRLVQFLRIVLPTESGLFNKPASVSSTGQVARLSLIKSWAFIVLQIDAQLLYVSRKRVKAAVDEQDISADLRSIVETLLTFVGEEFADV